MDPDVVMTIGVLLGAVSFPSVIHNVLHDGRPSKVVGFTSLVALTVIVIAAVNKPGGYAITDIPEVVISVLRRLV
ncbi:MAG: hypothetical protein N2Z62_12260 [Rhodobacteraceae bacterium]|nr:hypothetical protein [Paracoccaceae bacterium]